MEGRSSWLRRGIALTSATFAVLAVISACDDRDYGRYNDCDYVVRRCRTVCDYWCDRWGCYPTCYDQCWGDCYITPKPPPGSTTPPITDAGAPPPVTDGGGRPNTDGGGVLCTSCASNDDCETGALCIFRGGPSPDAAAVPDSGAPTSRGFCGHACQAPQDCPEGFTCTNLGGTMQCLANNGVCQ
jgi:hypothetical protein